MFHVKVLIETYWNVKNSRNIASMSKATVLIETYWNVKKSTHWKQNVYKMVLIETYWNVKKIKSKTFPKVSAY